MAGTNPGLRAYKDTTMSTDPFTDETLSAIIDGEADAETVASVNADPAASARLAQMRDAVEFVAQPVPEAAPERRSATIAAAMAAATPAAPEVTSIAAARHQRHATPPSRTTNNRQWLAVAAAAIALIVAIPLVLQFRDSTESADTATAASEDAVDSASFDAGADDGDDAMDESDDAMEEEAAVGAEETADAAVAGDADAGDSAADDSDAMEADEPAESEEADGESTLDERLRVRTMASNLVIIDEFISLGTLTPVLTLDEVLEAGVSSTCADTLLAETPLELGDTPMFDIAYLDADGLAEPRLLIIKFNDDGTTTTLDAEDCAQLG